MPKPHRLCLLRAWSSHWVVLHSLARALELPCKTWTTDRWVWVSDLHIIKPTSSENGMLVLIVFCLLYMVSVWCFRMMLMFCVFVCRCRVECLVAVEQHKPGPCSSSLLPSRQCRLSTPPSLVYALKCLSFSALRWAHIHTHASGLASCCECDVILWN